MAHYVSNKEFYALLVKYKERCVMAEEQGKPVPQVPTDIAQTFIMMSEKLGTKANFAGYTYRDEMIGDGIENCLRAVHKFNPEKYNNPFAYFTQIIWYAFLRRINVEKKQTYVKYKALEHAHLEDILADEDGGAYSNFNIDNEKMIPIIEKFEKSYNKKLKKKIGNKGIEKFIDDDEDSTDN